MSPGLYEAGVSVCKIKVSSRGRSTPLESVDNIDVKNVGKIIENVKKRKNVKK
jgi:hypothetical protein